MAPEFTGSGLIIYKMDDENFNYHLDEINTIVEKLSALTTPECSLLAENLFAATLFIAIPPNWSHIVSHLLDKPNFGSAQIAVCLKAKSHWRASRFNRTSPFFSSKASSSRPRGCFSYKQSSAKSSDNSSQSRSGQDLPLCSFCTLCGHEL